MRNSFVEKHNSLIVFVVRMVFWTAIIQLAAFLIVAGIFFYREVTKIYDDMDENIAHEAITIIDDKEIQTLSIDCNNIFRKICSSDDPKTIYNMDSQEFINNFQSIMDTQEYQDVWKRLNAIRSNTASTALDLIMIYPEYNLGLYIMDASDVNVLPCGEIFELDMDKYYDKSNNTLKGFYSQSNKYGSLRTKAIPVYSNTENGIYTFLSSDIPTNVINARVRSFILQGALIALVSVLIISGIVILELKKDMIRPMHTIIDAADKFVDGYEIRDIHKKDTNIFEKIDSGKITEVKNLASALRSMELEMNSYLANLDSITREKERISTELDVARKIQAESLPSIFPPFPERDEFGIYATMAPAKEVGGDFYDFFFIDDDHLALVIADVSGKGVPAAMLMMASKILLQNRAMLGGTPSEVLEFANEQLCTHNVEDMFVTVWFGIYTVSTGEVIAANAGHEYPVVMDEKGDFALMKDKHGPVLGAMEGIKYRDYNFTLKSGEKLYIYTDGVTEATDNDNNLWGVDNMLSALNSVKSESAEQILQKITDSIDEYTRGVAQFDDITQLCIERVR